MKYLIVQTKGGYQVEQHFATKPTRVKKLDKFGTYMQALEFIVQL